MVLTSCFDDNRTNSSLELPLESHWCSISSSRGKIALLTIIAKQNHSNPKNIVTELFFFSFSRPITGASMNPARSIGPAIVAGVYKNLWVFVVAPILGALAATMIYSILRSPKPKTYEEDTKNVYNDLYLENP